MPKNKLLTTKLDCPLFMIDNTIKNKYVKQFYDGTASAFSSTRRTPWPLTKKFIDENCTPLSLILDVGCGNGRSIIKKNIVGLDLSINLLKCAKKLKSALHPELILNDSVSLPFKSGEFDFVLSIAVVHHFPSISERQKAVSELYRVLKIGGKAFICVWGECIKNQKKVYAMEDINKSDCDENDCLVSWKGNTDNMRFYHLFREGELEGLLKTTGFSIIESGVEDESIYAIVSKN